MAARSAPLVRVVRSGLEESVHLGDVAVCDATGRLIASAGDPNRLVFVRSCTKPVQAAVAVDATRLELSDRLVAIMAASHNGEPVHLRAVRDVLRLGGLTEADLQTPADRPLDGASARRVREPRPLYHNCSGKHAGIGADDVAIGIDGCGAPVHGMGLRAAATMYAGLSDPDRQGRLAPAVGRVVTAMRAEPYLVGGRNRIDTEVMRAAPNVLAKEGAEALTCAVALGDGLGIAVKVGDGGYRAAGPALIAVLDQLGLLSGGARRRLAKRASPPVLGGGRPVGRLEPVLTLRTSR
ncbi:MAG: asparaginase [Actinobacteria bacterium]|nr:MAG: asparaginase [Actinomycetota bacterium]